MHCALLAYASHHPPSISHTLSASNPDRLPSFAHHDAHTERLHLHPCNPPSPCSSGATARRIRYTQQQRTYAVCQSRFSIDAPAGARLYRQHFTSWRRCLHADLLRKRIGRGVRARTRVPRLHGQRQSGQLWQCMRLLSVCTFVSRP